jgi:hypothetical protein
VKGGGIELSGSMRNKTRQYDGGGEKKIRGRRKRQGNK